METDTNAINSSREDSNQFLDQNILALKRRSREARDTRPSPIPIPPLVLPLFICLSLFVFQKSTGPFPRYIYLSLSNYVVNYHRQSKLKGSQVTEWTADGKRRRNNKKPISLNYFKIRSPWRRDRTSFATPSWNVSLPRFRRITPLVPMPRASSRRWRYDSLSWR